MQAYISEESLFHFVGRSQETDDGRFDLLCKIIRDGTLSHAPHTQKGSKFGLALKFDDKGHWDGRLLTEKGVQDKELIFDNLVCLADIPTAQLGLYMQKYSRFGIAINKRCAAESGARPVVYYPYWEEEPWRSLSGQSAIAMIERNARTIAEDRNCDEQLKKLVLMDFIGFLKPFNMSLPPDHVDQCYGEREWRKIGYLHFSEAHIANLVVPEEYVEELREMFPHLASVVAAAPPVQNVHSIERPRVVEEETI